MVTIQTSPDVSKPSFATVAAAITTDPQNDRTEPRNSIRDTPKMAAASTTVIVDGSSDRRRHKHRMDDTIDGVVSSLEGLKMSSTVPSLVVDGSSAVKSRQASNLAKDDASDDAVKADSSSDLGTKPPSIDGKSIASGTTFALDEKESLRPDDSASVKAAAEDDDALSIRGSHGVPSRLSSDVAVKGRNIQYGDMAERRGVLPPAGIAGPGMLTPQSMSSDRGPALTGTTPLSGDGSSDALNVIYRQAPDEKLLEALASPRDRYFLLRLEKEVIDFVQDSKEPYMDLPPSNSFCRMLTHKLADYYHMTHSYEPQIGSVRIFRTPFCRVPPSLAAMAPTPSASASSTPPPAVMPRKIMRRGQDSDAAVTGSDGLKATSESEGEAKDSKDKTQTNQKPSREEREEMYKQARERIFGSAEGTPQENEEEAGISRTSSVSATNRAANTKRGKTGKQRRDDSDSFDSRNQYTPYWGPQQPSWIPQPQAQYAPPGPGQYANPAPPSYPPQVSPVYGQQTTSYAPMVAPPTNYPNYGMQQFPPQPVPQRYPPSGSPMSAYGTPIAPPAVPQPWAQPMYAQPSMSPRVPPPGSGPAQIGIPYAYGQLPANANPNDPKSQHPIPGSYNRNHAFNPKTQSFIPGGNMMQPVPPPQPPFTAPGSHHSSPQIGTPPLAYGGFAPAAHPGYGAGYMMARQGSTGSMPGYAPAMHVGPPMTSAMPHGVPQNPHGPAHIPGRPPVQQGPNTMYTHLPTYGNPATLPQKPASGI